MSAHADQVTEAVTTTAGVVEAVLFTGGPPVSLADLSELLEATDQTEIISAAAQLNQLYHRQGRPYEIRRTDQGYQMLLRPQFSSIVRRLYCRIREVRLSVASVEVLSMVGYRQPVTILEIDSVRGVDSAAIIRQLCRRNLIEGMESDEGGCRTVRFKTTRRFLELFHLTSLDDLPRDQELEKP